MQPLRQCDLIGWNSQAGVVEIIDLRAHFDHPRLARAQDPHGFRFEMKRQLLPVSLVRGTIEDHQIDRVARDLVLAHQRGEQRVGERREAGLIEQRCPGGGVGEPRIPNVGSELLGERQRGESCTAQRD